MAQSNPAEACCIPCQGCAAIPNGRTPMAKSGRKKRVRAGSDNSSGENSADQPDLKEASEFAKRRPLLMERTTIPPGLENEERRDEWELPKSTTKPGHYMVELNL